MNDDRKDFAANRDAGLVKRHEQRLARARELGRPEECLAHRVLGITPHICLLTPGHEGDHVWTADREAEPQSEMVAGSGQPPRSDATYPMDEDPVTDMVIPPEAPRSARPSCPTCGQTAPNARYYRSRCLDGWHQDHPVIPSRHQAIEAGIKRALSDFGAELSGCTPAAITGHIINELALLPTEADTKALVETATRLATLLALEEAAKLADDLAAGVVNPEKPYNEAFVHACGVVARHIREIATKEPK